MSEEREETAREHEADSEESETLRASLDIQAPTSALKGRSLAGLLLGGTALLGTGAAGGTAVGSGFSAQQQLDLNTQIQQVESTLQGQITDLRTDVAYLRGKLGLVPSASEE